MALDPSLSKEAYCYLTTTGRVSGEPHTIEIWFALVESTLYLLAGNHRSDWVLNLRRKPGVIVRLRDTTYDAAARIVTEPAEDALARRLLLEKYTGGYGGDLTAWSRTALPVAIDVRSALTHT